MARRMILCRFFPPIHLAYTLMTGSPKVNLAKTTGAIASFWILWRFKEDGDILLVWCLPLRSYLEKIYELCSNLSRACAILGSTADIIRIIRLRTDLKGLLFIVGIIASCAHEVNWYCSHGWTQTSSRRERCA
eukprot:1326652-Amorphochlora_amoeboformis.AAC.1